MWIGGPGSWFERSNEAERICHSSRLGCRCPAMLQHLAIRIVCSSQVDSEVVVSQVMMNLLSLILHIQHANTLLTPIEDIPHTDEQIRPEL